MSGTWQRRVWSLAASVVLLALLAIASSVVLGARSVGAAAPAGATPARPTPLLDGGAPVSTVSPEVAHVPASVVAETLGTHEHRSGAKAWSGNNPEAERFALSAYVLWQFAGLDPGVHIRLELTPSYSGELSGDALLQYRRSVQLAVLTTVIDDASQSVKPARQLWQCRSIEEQARVLHTLVDLVLRESMFGEPRRPRELDYYPNASVRVVVADDRGEVLALGSWLLSTSGSSRELRLQVRPGLPPRYERCWPGAAVVLQTGRLW